VPQNLWMGRSCRSATAQSAFRRRTFSVVQRGRLSERTLFASDLTRKAQKCRCAAPCSPSLFRPYVQYRRQREILSPKVGRCWSAGRKKACERRTMGWILHAGEQKKQENARRERPGGSADAATVR
jgi:hypothetical protein